MITYLQQSLNQYFVIIILCILGIFFNANQANAQFDFPSEKVLKNNKVRVMKVHRTPLRFTGGPKKTREPLMEGLAPKRSTSTIFYFNAMGSIDSIIHSPYGSQFSQKDYFRYGEDHTLIEYTSINAKGQELRRCLTQKNQDQGWTSQGWEYGKLRSRSKINTDSIIYETLFFSPPDTNSLRMDSFDIEKNMRIEYWRNDKGEYRRETYQWFTENGQPKSFKHTLTEKKEGRKKLIYKEKEYPLDSAGNVVNKYLGRFDDPYIRYNYFKRFDKLKPIYFPEKSRFKAEDMIYEKEVETLYTFDGVMLIYLYELEYN